MIITKLIVSTKIFFLVFISVISTVSIGASPYIRSAISSSVDAIDVSTSQVVNLYDAISDTRSMQFGSDGILYVWNENSINGIYALDASTIQIINTLDRVGGVSPLAFSPVPVPCQYG